MGKLHDQMKRDLELKHYSPKTRWVRMPLVDTKVKVQY